MAYLSVAIINVAIIALTAFLFHSTEGAWWSLLPLFFLHSVRKSKGVD